LVRVVVLRFADDQLVNAIQIVLREIVDFDTAAVGGLFHDSDTGSERAFEFLNRGFYVGVLARRFLLVAGIAGLG
jgi:hypothetical protein